VKEKDMKPWASNFQSLTKFYLISLFLFSFSARASAQTAGIYECHRDKIEEITLRPFEGGKFIALRRYPMAKENILTISTCAVDAHDTEPCYYDLAKPAQGLRLYITGKNTIQIKQYTKNATPDEDYICELLYPGLDRLRDLQATWDQKISARLARVEDEIRLFHMARKARYRQQMIEDTHLYNGRLTRLETFFKENERSTMRAGDEMLFHIEVEEYREVTGSTADTILYERAPNEHYMGINDNAYLPHELKTFRRLLEESRRSGRFIKIWLNEDAKLTGIDTGSESFFLQKFSKL
jgi:hypothetical protein